MSEHVTTSRKLEQGFPFFASASFVSASSTSLSTSFSSFSRTLQFFRSNTFISARRPAELCAGSSFCDFFFISF